MTQMVCIKLDTQSCKQTNDYDGIFSSICQEISQPMFWNLKFEKKEEKKKRKK